LGDFQTRRALVHDQAFAQIAFWAEATLILVVPFLLYALVRSWRAVPVIPLSFVAKRFSALSAEARRQAECFSMMPCVVLRLA
jgi:hypothetical protein